MLTEGAGAGAGARPAVTDAAFVAPCLLPAPGAALVLELTASTSTGAVQLAAVTNSAASTPHSTSRLAAMPQRQAMQSRSPPIATARAVQTLLSRAAESSTVQPPRAACGGEVAAPAVDASGAYYQHPAAADATLHLSALASQLLDSTAGSPVARVPVGASLFAGPSRIAGGAGGAAWAAVEVELRAGAAESLTDVWLQSSLAATNSSGSASSGFGIRRLLARALGARQQPAAPPQQQLEYEACWQAAALAPALDQAELAAPSRGALAVAVGGCSSFAVASAGPLPAAQLLQALQSSEAARGARYWVLAGSGGAGAMAPAAEQRASAGAASAGLHGLIKVAAAESVIPGDAGVAFSSPLAPGQLSAAAAQVTQSSGRFGAAVRAGLLHTPVLLPSSWKAQRMEQPQPQRAHLQAVVISGGLGGLGLLAAAWLQAASQTRHLVLLGRSGRAAAAAAPLAAALTRSDSSCRVTLLRCDVAADEEARAAVAAAGNTVHSVLHAGGVLADAALQNQTATKLRTVAAPKLGGTQQRACTSGPTAAALLAFAVHQLHPALASLPAGAYRLAAATANAPLQHQLLFSSIAGVLGTAGQGSYAAANAALDEVAATAAQRGQPSHSLQWGAWAGAGMAAAEPQLLQKLTRQGYGAVDPAAGLGQLHSLLLAGGPGIPGLPAALVAAPFNWPRFLGGQSGSLRQLPFFAGVAAPPPQPQQRQQQQQQQAEALPQPPGEPAAAAPAATAPTAAQLLPVVLALLGDLTGQAPADGVGTEVPFLEAGLDSIGAVELRCLCRRMAVQGAAVAASAPLSWPADTTPFPHACRNAVCARFGVTLPATAVFDHPTPSALVTAVVAELAASAPAAAHVSVLALGKPLGAGRRPAGLSTQQLEEQLCQLLADTAGVLVASVDQPLMDAGVDSIGSVELRWGGLCHVHAALSLLVLH